MRPMLWPLSTLARVCRRALSRCPTTPSEPQWLLSMDYASGNNNYTHVMGPNSISCMGTPAFGISDASWGGLGAAISATSNHPGGVNVGFADGSVKFIKDSINLQTWWALGSRN